MTSTPGASVRRTGSNARALLLLVISITCPSALCQVLQHSKISLPGAALETREEALKLKGPHRPPEILVLAPDDDMFPYSLHKVVPAVMVAVDYLQHSRNLTLVVNYNNTNCSSSHGPLLAFDHYIAGKVDVFLGPTCSYVLAPVARYSAEWDLPVLTSSGQNDNFDMKHPNYRLLTRMNGSFTQVGQLFIETLRRFGWQVVAFLFHEFRERTKGHSDCFFNLAAVFNALGGGHMFHQKFDEEDPSLDLETLMQQVARNARIVVICASPDTVREIMLTADDLGMDNGDFVFFSVELFTTRNTSNTRPWYRESDTAERNHRARKAYEALLVVQTRIPETSEFSHFKQALQETARKEFEFDYNTDEVNPFVSAFYEAVILYALAINETIIDGMPITNGSYITQKMWNRTFEGITGAVRVNEKGDRDLDYSILDMNPETGQYQVVANYLGMRHEFVDVPNRTIHWAGGRTSPPPDVPRCGFDGSQCADESQGKYMIITSVLGTLMIIVCLASFFVYRHFKLEAELASMTWKIRWEDINQTLSNKHGAFGSRISFGKAGSSTSSETLALRNDRQMFIRTAYYKDTLVAIKPLNKARIDITRSLLLELKYMKDLQHDHIVRFIGACIDPPHCCLVKEYCPKGSLQDILENEEIKLDWMFRFSLMHDLVKGMAYLHNSEIHSHGNLKSSNCVVDSRFVLKITDFGLHNLRAYDENENEDTYAYWRRKLWTAPELLRSPEAPVNGTQKGDIYSFAIISHEIAVRQGVFYLGNIDMSPKEIVEQVISESKPLFRPVFDEVDCPDEVRQLITKCWAGDPNERPDFQALKPLIRKLNKESESGNILDNLLSRMEQYANNLESLVEERTADYLEEKRKAEDLLYQLLPKSVASQLIKGQSVRAESYDIVTIYFSDIVGFTSLSAQSTPMQVVDLLNDLYTCFDSVIESFDVYKVETIGDAYMVVSGLPVRNGIMNAREIARMSLALLKQVLSFKIRHRPGEQLNLRIGIHTGACAAGVVGLKMPRYCLFGDTVNTASRMESNGLPLRIHVSSSTKEVLDTFKTFQLELRGEVEMKGKGKMTTYWLLGEQDRDNSSTGPLTPTAPSTEVRKETKI
ncbi:atrial natriuretic peptide receptor 1 [Dermacentor silvarum]|uniref:atrial natriuretic peptide receptor 1 n=1 Tax=Dermacentor silvarum TaxID=543639 RepID=UPI00189AAE44|nr:atrial natriuretic peptide receptor 1 [Dermacentor silvarum]